MIDDGDDGTHTQKWGGRREGGNIIQFFSVGALSSVGVGCYLTACFTDSWFPLFSVAGRETFLQ